jgi:hypothetical protein
MDHWLLLLMMLRLRLLLMLLLLMLLLLLLMLLLMLLNVLTLERVIGQLDLVYALGSAVVPGFLLSGERATDIGRGRPRKREKK